VGYVAAPKVALMIALMIALTIALLKVPIRLAVT